MTTRSVLLAIAIGAAVSAAPLAATAGWIQSQPSADGAARAGDNAGSSSLTPTRAPRSTAPPAATADPMRSQTSTDGAARAGDNAGSSSLTPTRAPRRMKPVRRHRATPSHRLPANATGMGSQAASTTGPTSNSH